MTKKKSTKRALFGSMLALLLCFTMLLGTTFAWFTDTASSGGNKIVTGTLDVDLEVLDEDTGDWVSVTDTANPADPLFNYENWEPGYTEVKVLRVVNNGTLALKWKATLFTEDTLTELADVIDVYVKKDVTAYPTSADREAVTGENGWDKVGTLTQFVSSSNNTITGKIEAGTGMYETVGIAFKMQESADNKYQNMDLGGAFDICVIATQDTVEDDFFDNTYDENADFPGEASTVQGLKSALAEGGRVTLLNDLTAEGDNGLFASFLGPITSTSVLDLNGKTLTNATTTTGTNNLIIHMYDSADITITGNGTMKFGDNMDPTMNNSLFFVCAMSTLTIENGTFDATNTVTSGGGNAVAGLDTTKVIINDGTFTGGGEQYLIAAHHQSEIFINGGTFENNGNVLINVADRATVHISGGFFRASEAEKTLAVSASHGGKINISGGTFVDYDPSGREADGIVVEAGYKVTSETKDSGEVWYTVVEDTTV